MIFNNDDHSSSPSDGGEVQTSVTGQPVQPGDRPQHTHPCGSNGDITERVVSSLRVSVPGVAVVHVRIAVTFPMFSALLETH